MPRPSRLPTVAILSPGDMGHSIGQVLRQGGLRVVTSLTGRGPRSRSLAAEAGMEDLADDRTLVREADLLLSVLPPSEALGLAGRIASALGETGADLLYADCNAVSPGTVRDIARTLVGTRARFVDVGIIGSPPRVGGTGTHFYASGPHAQQFADLEGFGIAVKVLPGDIGQASGFKMCYASLTKGLTAIGTELLVAAEKMGLLEELRDELGWSQPVLLQWLIRQIPGMPPKAYRWVGEMLEIASTFEQLDLTPLTFQGAAEMYRLVGRTSLAAEIPETRQRGQTLEDVVELLVGETSVR